MTRHSATTVLFALALLATLDLGRTLPGGMGIGFVSPAFAQDDDGGGDDDGGDDDGGDDDGGDDNGGGAAGAGDDDDDRGQVGGQQGSGPTGRKQGGGRTERRAPATPEVAPLPVRAAGEVVVSGLTEQDLAALRGEGFDVIETFTIVRNGPVLHRLAIPPGLTLEQARERVRARESGRNADFNHYYRAGEAVAPPPTATAVAAAPCAHLNCDMLAQIRWPVQRPPGCAATVEIGVIDTSVNLDHAGLARAQVELIRVAGPDMPASGETHGTAVVAMLAGSEVRAPGLVPEARVVAIDIFSQEGGDERADVAHLVQALDIMAQRGVRVANLSLAGPENTVLSEMLTAVADSGMLVVAAAGNAGPAAPPAWPAAAETVLAVTAVDARDQIYRRAQRGPHVDVAAPGVEVWSAASVKGVKPRTGTSFAAPFATAAAAILMSRHPEATPTDIAAQLRALTRDLGTAGADEIYGAGVLTLGALCDSSVE